MFPSRPARSLCNVKLTKFQYLVLCRKKLHSGLGWAGEYHGGTLDTKF